MRILRSTLPFALAAGALLPGCGRLHPGAPPQSVYVISKGTYIRDRLAAISNHVADIHNGEKLTVVEHTRRFYKVRTAAGQEGWLEEHSVIDQAEFDKFQALTSTYSKAPAAATGVLRDAIFLHLTPGRKTEHFYLLPENDRLQLLIRASVPKPLSPQALLQPPSPRPRRPTRPQALKPVKREQSGSTIYAQAPPHPDRYTAPDLDPDAPWMAQPMEDWWLVRDPQGRTGWVLAHGLDIAVPDEVAQYSEGRRIVGAYLLNTVMDDGQPPERHIGPQQQQRLEQRAAAKTAFARRHPKQAADQAAAVPLPPAPVPHPVGQYVTVTNAYKDGLPYDWDQVRVFIWNLKKHRYETAYRLRDQQGYLPVVTGSEPVDKFGPEPTFTIRTSPDGVVTQDDSGVFHPKTVQLTQYRLEGGIVRRDTPMPGRPGDAPGPPGSGSQPVGSSAAAARLSARHRPQQRSNPHAPLHKHALRRIK